MFISRSLLDSICGQIGRLRNGVSVLYRVTGLLSRELGKQNRVIDLLQKEQQVYNTQVSAEFQAANSCYSDLSALVEAMRWDNECRWNELYSYLGVSREVREDGTCALENYEQTVAVPAAEWNDILDKMDELDASARSALSILVEPEPKKRKRAGKKKGGRK